MEHFHTNFFKFSKILPPSSKKSIITGVVFKSNFQSLTELIGKGAKVYEIKLVSLDITSNIFLWWCNKH